MVHGVPWWSVLCAVLASMTPSACEPKQKRGSNEQFKKWTGSNYPFNQQATTIDFDDYNYNQLFFLNVS